MQPSPFSAKHLKKIVRVALREDIPRIDLTTDALFPKKTFASARIVAQEAMTVAGLVVAQMVFREIDPSLIISLFRQDGDVIKAKTTLMTIEGDGRSILKGERVALNFLQHLSGVSTLTSKFCRAVKNHPTQILDTRKTTPGLRVLEKWAVTLGGGMNHRFNLSQEILIKDNHLALLREHGLGLEDACREAKKKTTYFSIQNYC